ncbi:MAG: YifB family Mg chelatase-like AAA ATPase [Candidatus Gracilibacteria bacterium]|nr:YifB family Mg chelatase-like AAA ATPase [Candidatus Gracilibacteria bacterium]
MRLLHSMVLQGIYGLPIFIEIDTQPGIPSFTIVGLGDASIQESRERIRSAVKNSEYSFPVRRVTINLAPAHIRKTGSHFDLAIAIGLILQDAIKTETSLRLQETLILGELALDGKLRPLIGTLPLIISARKQGFTQVMIPSENMEEVWQIDGIKIIAVGSLSEGLAYFLSGIIPIPTPQKISNQKTQIKVPLESIIGQNRVKRGLIIAASGGHNLLLEGPPGSGKSMLCSALQGILPKLNQEESLEVAQIYSVVGLALPHGNKNRPFRHIHHTASAVSIVGGGKYCRPGEMSLAHHGVLFMDEILEFDRPVIESLREPMESREIHISRAFGTYTYPASFMLVGAMNPCPCGYLGDTEHICKDTANEILKYRSKLSGPILDRIDIFLTVPRVPLAEIQQRGTEKMLTTTQAKQQVEAAVQIAMQRQNKLNTNLLPQELEKMEIESEAYVLLQQAMERLSLSLRAYHRILRVSRTIADLEGTKKIAPAHVAEAIGYRQN